MELIKITNNNGQNAVSARELYNFLEVKTDFTDWCKRMFEYGFIENQDFTILLKNEEKVSKSNPIDYALTLDCAKEIAMLQRSDKGKQARQYFIECEKALLQPKVLTLKEMAQLVILQESEKEALNAKIIELEPKRIFAEAVSASKTSILVGELAKILKQNDIDMGQNRLFEELRTKGYLIKRIGTDFNMPTQKSMELGLFEIKETSITHSDGHITISKTPKVTGKGQVYFTNYFFKNNVKNVVQKNL